jgi:subtilisin-like proprotein convertase family protein
VLKFAGELRMDVRSAAQRIVAVLVIVAGGALPVFATPVYIYSGDFNLRIPNEANSTRGWMADAILEIPDHFAIHDLDVGITLTHTSVFDLQIFLLSPAGTILCLNAYNFDEFFVGENYTQTIFDDEAQIPIELAGPPFTGRFRPRPPGLLEVFDGQDSFGLWRLRIYDAFHFDSGMLNSFELTVTAPEPATAILLTLGMGLVSLFRPRRNR